MTTNEENKAPEATTEAAPKKKKKSMKNVGENFIKEFKAFINKGNILQLAIAFVLGVAFAAVVNSLVGDIIMQFLSLLLGKSNFASLVWLINGTPIRYGAFLLAVINFLIIALVLFFTVKIVSSAGKKLRRKQEPVTPPAPPAETMEKILKDIREELRKDNEKK